MKNILVPTDFSDNSVHALSFAVDLANKLSANIILLNTYEIAIHAGMMVSLSSMIEKDTYKALEQFVQQFEERLEEGLEFVLKVHRGTPSTTITGLAEMEKSALIIMGTRGEHDFPDRILGTTSANVIKQAKCPVLMIPEFSDLSALNHLAYATDLHSNDNRIYAYLDDFTRLLNIDKTTFVSVEKDKDEIRNLVVEDDRFQIIHNESIVDGLLDYISRDSVDILAMFKPHRTFWNSIFHTSTTKEMSIRSKVPLLVLHEQ